MRTRGLLAVVVVGAGLLCLGCSKDKAEASGSASSDTSQAKAASGSADEVKAVCSKMCDKAVECAVELAKEAAKGAGDDEAGKKAIAEEQKAAKDNLADCKQSCNREKITDTDRAEVAEAKTCLALGDCKKFMDCLEKVGTVKK
jgi:hypothetical protein